MARCLRAAGSVSAELCVAVDGDQQRVADEVEQDEDEQPGDQVGRLHVRRVGEPRRERDGRDLGGEEQPERAEDRRSQPRADHAQAAPHALDRADVVEDDRVVRVEDEREQRELERQGDREQPVVREADETEPDQVERQQEDREPQDGAPLGAQRVDPVAERSQVARLQPPLEQRDE
jgi:hypothetical protein